MKFTSTKNISFFRLEHHNVTRRDATPRRASSLFIQLSGSDVENSTGATRRTRRGARSAAHGTAEEQSTAKALRHTLRTAEPSVVAVPWVCEVRLHFFLSIHNLLNRSQRQELWSYVNKYDCFNVKKQTSLDMTKIASETKCTIVVVGDSRTGKSALLHRFVHKSFQPVRHILLLSFKYVVLTIDIFFDNQLLRLDRFK